MVRNLLGLCAFLVAIWPSQQTPISTDSLLSTLSRAEALYYEAQFNESIQLLAPLDLPLAEQPSRSKDSVKVKLQLAVRFAKALLQSDDIYSDAAYGRGADRDLRSELFVSGTKLRVELFSTDHH